MERGGCVNSVRRPTLLEAVAHLIDAKTDVYRRLCIAYWRQRYGDSFADAVRAEAHKKLKKGA